MTEPVLVRDPRDAELVARSVTVIALLTLLLVASFGATLWLALRRPDRIVVDRGSGRVVEINNRDYGRTDAVAMEPDAVGDEDKLYAAREWAAGVYALDPATRAGALKRSLELMTPEAARVYAEWLSRERVLERQRAESHQAIWRVQDATLDERDRWTVRLIGEQHLTKIVAGRGVDEQRQVQVTVKLAADPSGRSDRNIRTGVQVVRFDERAIDGAPS